MKTTNQTLLAALMLLAISCTKENTTIQSSSVAEESSVQADINASVGSVTIGTQVWMKRDLTTSFYRNGDPIPQVQDAAAWASLTTGAWCWYKDNPAMGKLYNCYAVHDPRGLAPTGWHVPSDAEWTTLATSLGGETVAGGKMKETGTTHWLSPNTDATNSSGFKALPGGGRYTNGSFKLLGSSGYWWSSTGHNTGSAWARNLSYNNGLITNGSYDNRLGFSVRCVQDAQQPTNDSVIIGTQVWKTKNLNVSNYRNGDPIPQITDPASWAALTNGAWCWYNNDSANGAIYGKLYNWYAVNDSRGLAPAGWHVPSDAEWTTLTTYLGGESVAGGKMKETGTTHWYAPNYAATNSSGFTGLPGGNRRFDGTFFSIGGYGYWWSSTAESNTSSAWYRYLYNNNSYTIRGRLYEQDGFSVRCIKD